MHESGASTATSAVGQHEHVFLLKSDSRAFQFADALEFVSGAVQEHAWGVAGLLHRATKFGRPMIDPIGEVHWAERLRIQPRVHAQLVIGWVLWVSVSEALRELWHKLQIIGCPVHVWWRIDELW